MLNPRDYFDRAADTYERACRVQREVVLKLAELIPKGHYETVVEIGSGVGSSTQVFLEKITFSRYVNIDLSLRLLLKSKAKFKESLYYVNGRVEHVPIRCNSADLLLSSSSLHWAQDLESALKGVLRLLKGNGRFFLSIFVHPTLREIELASKFSGFGSVFPLRDVDEYLQTIESLREFKFHYEVKTFSEKFTSVIDILKFLKLTGANFTPHKRFSGKGAFIRFCNFYERNFSEGENLYCTFKVLFIEGQRVSPSPQG